MNIFKILNDLEDALLEDTGTSRKQQTEDDFGNTDRTALRAPVQEPLDALKRALKEYASGVPHEFEN